MGCGNSCFPCCKPEPEKPQEKAVQVEQVEILPKPVVPLRPKSPEVEVAPKPVVYKAQYSFANNTGGQIYCKFETVDCFVPSELMDWNSQKGQDKTLDIYKQRDLLPWIKLSMQT